MLSNLLVLIAIQTTIPYIECTVLLAQVVITLAVSSPYWCTVFALEVGKLSELLVLRHHPDVTTDGRLVVLTVHVLAALDVVIEYITGLAVDVHVGHRQCGVHTWTPALNANLVYLWELAQSRDDSLATWHVGHAEQHVVVVAECKYVLVVAACCNLCWYTTVF